MKKIRYYKTFDEDFVETADQNYCLPEDYIWIRKGIKAKLLSFLTYAAALVVGGFYCKTVLHVTVKNKKLLPKNEGCFIYGNHTQPFGDVIIPALAALPKRIYTLCSPSNLGMKGIGKALPYLGALPIPQSITGINALSRAIETRLTEGSNIVIYPEVHVWEYYTDIRPFSSNAFLYPVKYKRPVYCMTAVYTKHKLFIRPKMTVYIDGPFFPDPTLSRRQQSEQLYETVYSIMKKRTSESNVEYIKYTEKV